MDISAKAETGWLVRLKLLQRSKSVLWLAVALLASGGIFWLTYRSPVHYFESDPQPALLVAQAILQQGSPQLDAYRESAQMPWRTYKFIQRNDHTYYYFPLGGSLFSAPAVWIANRLGYDMGRLAHNYLLQNLLSALTCAAIFLLIYRLGRCLLTPLASLVIATVSVAGSGLVSTLGTALWSINFTVLFVLGALLIVVAEEIAQGNHTPEPFSIRTLFVWHWPGVWLGVFLFAACLCRPSSVPFILVVLLYVFILQPRLFVATALTSGLLLAGYLFYNWREVGSPLAEYYTLDRFSAHAVSFWVALYGHLLSPARGILVFSPFLIIPLLGILIYGRTLYRQPLLWFCLGWFVVHLLAISRSTRWWGSWSFGPRVLTDVLPALILLTIVLWRWVTPHMGQGIKRLVVLSYLALGIVGIAINSYAGLFNFHAKMWNGYLPPNVDSDNASLFDWRYPQFLATRAMLCARNAEYMQQYMMEKQPATVTYALGTLVPTNQRDPANQLLTFYSGWGPPIRERRWVECPMAKIILKLGAIDTTPAYSLTMTGRVQANQTKAVLVNGVEVGRLSFQKGGDWQTYTVNFPAALLKANQFNELELRTLVAPSTPDDQYIYGLSFRDFVLAVDE